MDCSLTFREIINHLTLYEIVDLRLVCKGWKDKVDVEPAIWRKRYKIFLNKEPLSPKGEILLEEFKRDYMQIYTEEWMKRLHKFVLSKEYGRIITSSDYMTLYSMFYNMFDSSKYDQRREISEKIQQMVEGRNERILKSVNVVCRYVLNVSKIDLGLTLY